MPTLRTWFKAFRLRTLPLALSSIFLGSFLAYSYGSWKPEVLFLAILTTIFLQVLSNLANDYGDSQHGADHAGRTWAKRTIQAGDISPKAMLRAIQLCALLAFASGLTLLWVALNSWVVWVFFLILGIGSIVAAITYTVGKRPYGYAGLGDISVFFFFGWVGVLGTFFLHTQSFWDTALLPATSCGLLATAVLNINNIRDISSDQKAGKQSIPVRLGRGRAVLYHYGLLIIAWLLACLFVILQWKGIIQALLLCLPLPLLYRNAQAVRRLEEPHSLDPYLKQMAITTLIFVLCLGVGLLF